MNKTFRRATISTICMLVVAIMSLTGVTYAWFSVGTTASVESINVNVQTADGTLIIGYDAKAGGIVWGNTVSADTITVPSKMAPVSTAGTIVDKKVTFYTASIDASDTSKLTGVAAADMSNVISFNLYIDNKAGTEAADVYLARNSGIVKASGSNVESHLATRIGFVQWTNIESESAPTSSEAFTTVASTSAIIFEPNEGSHTGAGIAYQTASKLGLGADGNAKYPYYGLNAVADSANRYNDADAMAAVTTRTIGDGQKLFTVPAGYYGMVTVYVWLEGQDADCLNDIAAGNFTVNLNFQLKTDVVAG